MLWIRLTILQLQMIRVDDASAEQKNNCRKNGVERAMLYDIGPKGIQSQVLTECYNVDKQCGDYAVESGRLAIVTKMKDCAQNGDWKVDGHNNGVYQPYAD